MINADELRVGSLFLNVRNSIHRVNNKADLAFIKSAPKCYNPVILNGEIAAALGFPKDGFIVNCHTYQPTELIIYGKVINIEHVHELQNAYYDHKGIELPINREAILETVTPFAW